MKRLARLLRERRREPTPRFLPDLFDEPDEVLGWLEKQIPQGHLSRLVKAQVAGLDVSSLEAKYSSLGRHGYHPRHMLGVLVYAGTIKLQYSTEISAAMRTDAALRYVGGGYTISAGKLREFRRQNGDYFRALVGQTIALALKAGILDTQAIAIDSVRLRAEASARAVGTLKRSHKRLVELAKVDTAQLNEEDLAEHEAKLEKHNGIIRACEEQQRTNVVATSPSAGLMKFPDGASGPGQRVTASACGVKERFIIDVFIDATSTDFGKLGRAVINTRAALTDAGVPLDGAIQVAADAGYFSTADLVFAANNPKLVDALIAEGKIGPRKSSEGDALFSAEEFPRNPDGSVTCPAGLPMKGPHPERGTERWYGTGCATCELKPRCTNGKTRSIFIDLEYQHARDAMRRRMAQPGARERYNKRIATIEPVFSGLQNAMGFRRVSSRNAEAVRAEIFLKVLTYNLGRLRVAKTRLRNAQMIANPVIPEPDAAAADP